MSSSRVVEADPTTKPALRRSSRWRRVLGLCLLAVGVTSAAAGGYWWSQHKYEYIPKRWGVVVPEKIYRSGQLSKEVLEDTLTGHGITTIIDLQLYDIQDEDQQAEVQYAAEQGLRLFRFPLAGDGTGDFMSYVETVALLIECERDNQPVLVHCGAGTQRTGGVIACYRLLRENAEPRAIVRELRQYDWSHKDRELIDYLNANLPQIAQLLVERGALSHLPQEIPTLEE